MTNSSDFCHLHVHSEFSLLDGATWDPARVGTATWTASRETRTAAYAAAHALSHLGEHVGHLHMTLELLRDDA